MNGQYGAGHAECNEIPLDASEKIGCFGGVNLPHPIEFLTGEIKTLGGTELNTWKVHFNAGGPYITIYHVPIDCGQKHIRHFEDRLFFRTSEIVVSLDGLSGSYFHPGILDPALAVRIEVTD